MITYVHEGTEVKLTGREAIRKVKTLPNKPDNELKLVEITPVKDFDWVKWVNPVALYKVEDNSVSPEL